MNQKFLITKIFFQEKKYLLWSLLEEEKIVELYVTPVSSQEILGNIYVGRVKDVVKNLNAAFVEISPGNPCYLPLEDLKNPIYVKKIHETKLVQGQELLVQVEKESMKTKPPKVTTNLSFSGKYLIVTTGIQSIGVSGKIEKQKRLQLKELLEKQKDSPLGIIARTNSQNAEYSQILEEWKLLQKEGIGLSGSVHRTVVDIDQRSGHWCSTFIDNCSQYHCAICASTASRLYCFITLWLCRPMLSRSAGSPSSRAISSAKPA